MLNGEREHVVDISLAGCDHHEPIKTKRDPRAVGKARLQRGEQPPIRCAVALAAQRADPAILGKTSRLLCRVAQFVEAVRQLQVYWLVLNEPPSRNG